MAVLNTQFNSAYSFWSNRLEGHEPLKSNSKSTWLNALPGQLHLSSSLTVFCQLETQLEHHHLLDMLTFLLCCSLMLWQPQDLFIEATEVSLSIEFFYNQGFFFFFFLYSCNIAILSFWPFQKTTIVMIIIRWTPGIHHPMGRLQSWIPACAVHWRFLHRQLYTSLSTKHTHHQCVLIQTRLAINLAAHPLKNMICFLSMLLEEFRPTPCCFISSIGLWAFSNCFACQKDPTKVL